jgi:hypothetical protein
MKLKRRKELNESQNLLVLIEYYNSLRKYMGLRSIKLSSWRE